MAGGSAVLIEDGKLKKLYCFLFIPGYLRTRYIEFVTDASTNTLIRCHANAFRYFGDLYRKNSVRQHEAGRHQAAAEAGRQHPEPAI
ncbi:hypothetical protein OBV_29250 [Oscillibacter valericigenes Sjm18-20]|nr:hypothetical protein OBV_29250 [Oscillibacter valericigenes Sjm18-20]